MVEFKFFCEAQDSVSGIPLLKEEEKRREKKEKERLEEKYKQKKYKRKIFPC